MPTLNKLEYLDETKQQIKTALNTKFNAGITDEDTFRSYRTKIAGIYNSWPKVTGAGTEVTLNNCKKGKMMAYLKGNTSQTTYTGKNLFNADTIIPASINSRTYVTYNNINKSFALTNQTSDSYFPSLYSTQSYINNINAHVKKNTDYTFSVKADKSNIKCGVYAWDSSEGHYRLITAWLTSSGSTTFNTENFEEVAIRFGSTDPTGTVTTFSEIQIEEGSTSTGYEPYCGGMASPNPDYPQDIKVATGTQKVRVNDTTNYLIPLGDIELCKIGNYYDYFAKTSSGWVKKKRIDKIVLNGSENWNKVADTSGDYLYFYSTILDNLVIKNYTKNIVCNKFNVYEGQIVYITNVNVDTINVSSSGTSQRLRVLLLNTRINNYTANDFKTWLSNNNVTIYYVLPSTVDEPVTGELLISKLDTLLSLMSVDGTNTINVLDNDEPERAIINVTALKGGA